MSLIDKRILIVTGKGGTGKTTVSATLGVLAARQGKKTIIVECNGAQHITSLFQQPPSTYTPTELLPGLSAMCITSEEAIEDYIVQQIKVRALYNLVFRNRIMGPFMDAVPGLHDASHLGKVFDLTKEKNNDGENRWDLIIVDAPATGHGLSLLASPKSMMDLTQRGPIFEGVRSVQEVIADATQTGIVLTCLPEPMPVNETIELFDALGIHREQVLACVLNQVDSAAMPDLRDWEDCSAVLRNHAEQSIREAVTWAEQWIARRERQVQANKQLHAHLGTPIVSLPLVFHASMGSDDVEHLADSMAGV